MNSRFYLVSTTTAPFMSSRYRRSTSKRTAGMSIGWAAHCRTWSRIAASNGSLFARQRGRALIRNMRTGLLTTQNERNGFSFK